MYHILDSTYKWYRIVFVFIWFTSLNMIISRSIHIAANGIISFFFYGWVVFHCIYVPHLLYPFISWWKFRLLPCLGYCIMLLWTLGCCMYLFKLEFSPDVCPGVRFLTHMVTLFLVFSGTSILFSIVAAPIYIPTNSVGGFPFLHTIFSIYYF